MLFSLLSAASSDDAWALATVRHLLDCMKQMKAVIGRTAHKEAEVYFGAMQAVTARLQAAAECYVHHQVLHELLKSAANAMSTGVEDASVVRITECKTVPAKSDVEVEVI